MNGHRYSEAEVEWLRENYPKLSRIELAEAFNRNFGTAIHHEALVGACYRRGILCGRTGQLNKGNVPWNKGRKGYFPSPKTAFKKGQEPYQTKPIGSERITKDNIVEVKVAKHKWRSKHTLLWEQYHGKPVPAGHVVIFLDGDRRNYDKSNLELVSRAQLASLNKQRFSQQHIELRPALISIARIDDKLRVVDNKGELWNQ